MRVFQVSMLCLLASACAGSKDDAQTASAVNPDLDSAIVQLESIRDTQPGCMRRSGGSTLLAHKPSSTRWAFEPAHSQGSWTVPPLRRQQSTNALALCP